MYSFLFFLVFLVQVSFAAIGSATCSTESDCAEGYFCHEKVCRKCLRCDMLFRKGNLCITDFNECEDCLEGYEEVLMTDFSNAIKLCKPVKKKVKLKVCENDNSCPQNTYCNEESCVKCFDCSLINRLPPVEKCAKGLNECGSCMIEYYEVAVTTDAYYKPCERNYFVVPKILISTEIIIVISICILIALILYYCIFHSTATNILSFKKFRGKNLGCCGRKSKCKPVICPSAPPLHLMQSYIPKAKEVQSTFMGCINEGKQQARVFKQPDALYYNISPLPQRREQLDNTSERNNARTSPNSWTPSDNAQSEETNCSPGYMLNDNLVLIDSMADSPMEQRSDNNADENGSSVRCRKCRHLLFLHPEITLHNAHGVSYSDIGVQYISCSTIQEDNVWFLQDNSLPKWISDVVNDSNWTKGKVNCPNCQGRLGSFDFVSGTQCQCGAHVLPPVHIVKCKVDCRNQR